MFTAQAETNIKYTVKEGNKLFLARESLVSDIPAGDGKTANLFFTVYKQYNL